MSRPARTFVAIKIPDDRAEKLQRLQTLIAPTFTGARWVEPGRFHVTLAFLGDVPDQDLNPVCMAVAEGVKDFRPIDLAILGLGVFPDAHRPRVVWAGLEGEVEALAAIQQAVVAAVRDAGYPPDDDRFHPHITLGRLKPRRDETADCGPLLRHHERWRGGSFHVGEVVTYASQFTAEGPAYVALGRAPLRGR